MVGVCHSQAGPFRSLNLGIETGHRLFEKALKSECPPLFLNTSWVPIGSQPDTPSVDV